MSMAVQSLLPDSFASRVRLALEHPSAQQLIQRFWAKDASLWTSDPAAQERIRQRLGWLSIVQVMEAQIEQIQAEVQNIRQEGFTHALLLGMGGSSLFPEVCRGTFGVAPGWVDLAVLDSTDPVVITAAQQRASLGRTLFIVSSKSGTTTETSALFDYFYDTLRRLVGEQEAGQQFVVITDAGTPLEKLARQRAVGHIFPHGPDTGQDVGGRFSALTFFGLVPAALMGIELERLLASAGGMVAACQPSVPAVDNPGAQLAVALAEAAAQGRDKVTLACGPSLVGFGAWAEQLLAESTGKDGRGLIPIVGEPLRDPEAYGPDRVFIELQLASDMDASVARKTDALARAGHPVVRVQWQDRYDLGGEAMRWFIATALAASLMRINAFDEPNVQESKDRTKALLDQYARERQLPAEAPLLTDAGMSVYGDEKLFGGSSLADVLQVLRKQIRAGDYVAILSFLPRAHALDTALESLRDRLWETLDKPVMLGHGPRYLHSTGQLHKGGADRAALLLLTADDPVDVPVPGKPYTFSVLKAAQALGDFQALRERKRRILRLHLGPSPEQAIRTLIEAVKR